MLGVLGEGEGRGTARHVFGMADGGGKSERGVDRTKMQRRRRRGGGKH